MAAPKPKLAPDPSGPRQPTALSAVFRRLAKEEPVIEPASTMRFEGFGEALAPAPPPEPRLPMRTTPARELPVLERAPFPRQGLRGRVRDWLGAAPPAFEAVPRAEADAAQPAAAASAPTPPRWANGSEPLLERAAHPSMPRNRRVYRRIQLPAEIEIDGVPCTLIDLSVGGFAATGVLPLEPDSRIEVAIRLTIDGIEVGTQLSARVIYTTPGRSSGRFVELAPSQMAFLRYLVTWRGESVGAVGTTTLLDAITGAAGRAPGESGRFAPPARERRWRGWLGRGA